MNEIGYSTLKEKVENLYQRSSELWNTGNFEASKSDFDIDFAPLNLVFAGQYSAGKSSLIKMLTGIERIKIGSGVTTDVVTQYQHKSINIWDTPGILAGECEQHDAKALEAISKADLLVYVITNELFDDVVGAAFRNLCFSQGRAKEMMIVINKFESDSADKETKILGITQVLEPKIPEDFPIVFTDAQSFFDALDEEDEQERQELLALSNAEGLTKAIDGFVAQCGLCARLTTPLQQLQNKLESKIDELTISDPLQKGLVSLLTQNKRVFQANRRDLLKKVGAHLDKLNGQIVEQGNQLADALGGEQEEFEKIQDSSTYECERLINSTLEDLQVTVNESLSDLEAELVELANTPASSKINEALEAAKNFNPEAEQGKVGSVAKDDPLKLNSALSQSMVKSAEKGFSFLAKSAVGDVSKTGLNSVSGSTLHNAVKEIGGFFGYKFKSWEAVKIADKIGKGAKFLGPAMAIFGVGMQMYDDYQQSEHAKNILKIKRDIRKNFKEYSDAVCRSIDAQLKTLLDAGFDLPITNIDEALHEIRSQAEGKSDSVNALRAQLDEVKNLREEIQGAY
ncbi:TPA: LeoA/HP0731 family dynamin-like GTPase [Yersinia enterocolitica]|uniref:GTPase domain-containing protein n=1 Tax=Yersinia TaxID=629 RepID=UPI001C60EEDA|nr:GTPase domain-containing protein [Yersinia kristensenii]ELI7901187.1 50S ribosome-binding GTPase [Yersinia enterocolitica]ELI8002679.1 50S ribosome-binding GTPase [Yersinia enterocolitica]ELX2216125.1 50S ribosome-binding GTPase [Yersinia enterocolitica]MBW5824672.1 50S ribosome-binding GTPase [Yersinia kristensenii]HEB1858577.1 50S ribosome-binding GTPase [Yersinia enterocolitica]